MREEKRTEERIVTSTRTIYIADDGKEFDSKTICEEYEREVKEEAAEKIIEKLRINELNGLLPLTNNDEWRDCDVSWFKLNDDSDFGMIYNYYDLRKATEYFYEPKSYPNIMCVVEYDCYADIYYIDDIIETTKDFYKDFGFDVTISKGE